MKKEAKASIIDELTGSISRAQVGVVTSYQGLPTPELVKLRHKLREAGIEYKVVKNTLVRRAVNSLGRDFLSEHFDGAIALALGYGDAVVPAKTLIEYIKASGVGIQIIGGFMPDRWLDAAQVDTLASLPSREVLIGRVVGSFSGPIYGLVNSLTSPMLGLVWALQARIQQMEGK